MAKKKANRKAPTVQCGKCSKQYHPRAKACPSCGKANASFNRQAKIAASKKPKPLVPRKTRTPSPARAQTHTKKLAGYLEADKLLLEVRKRRIKLFEEVGGDLLRELLELYDADREGFQDHLETYVAKLHQGNQR